MILQYQKSPGKSFTAMFSLRLLLALGLWMTGSNAFGFEISSVEANRVSEQQVTIEVDCKIELSAEVLEALSASIPITIQTTIKIYRVRNRLWDKLIHEYVLLDKITYQSLYKTYHIESTNSNTKNTSQSTYQSLSRFLAALREQRSHHIQLTDDVFEGSESYVGKIRISLDRSALPTEMRLPAFFKKSWRLKSDRIKFPIK